MDDIERAWEYRREMEAENAEYKRSAIAKNCTGVKRTREEIPFPVMVVTRNPNNLDEPPKRVVIDYNNSDHRKWLGKHSYWALRNNFSVTTHTTEDPITFVVKTPRSTFFRKES